MDQDTRRRRYTDDKFDAANSKSGDARPSIIISDENLAGNDTLTGLFLLCQISSGLTEDEIEVKL